MILWTDNLSDRKDPAFYKVLGQEYASFSTISNDLHRQRRAPLNPFFSRRSVFDLEGVVQDKTAKLCRVLGEGLGKGESVRLHDAFRAISIDVITDYAFDDCWNHLDSNDFGKWFALMVKSSGFSFWILQQFPFLLAPIKAIPPTIARKLSPTMRDMIDCQEVG